MLCCLQLTRNAHFQAYVRLVRRHHPDLLPTTARTDERDAAHQSLVEVNAAFAVLGTEASRRLYDVQRSGPVGMQVNARGYAGTYREGPASAPHVDKDGFDNQGFYHGSHKRQRERMFSDTTVVVAVVMWMVAGIVIHFWRFGEAHAAVTEYVTEENRKASSQLAKAKQRAQENGPQLQLAMLRDQHSGGSNPAVQSAPANHSTTTCASDVL